MRSDGESGWILLEAVLLGLIALATAAVLGIFARTALLEEHAAARMEAELDQGTEPLSAATQINSNDRSYQIERTITRAGEFYDVSLRISWQILGHEEQVDFVRRLRQHVRVETTP